MSTSRDSNARIPPWREGGTTSMHDRALVAYCGPDAESVGERWRDGNRPFELDTIATGDELLAHLDGDGAVDCVVVGDRPDQLVLVDRVRETLPSLPLVLLADGNAPEALDRGVTHVVPAADDRIELLESLATVVDRSRQDRQKRTMLDSLLAHIPLSIYFKDRESRYVRVSDAMLTMTGTDYIENDEGKRFHAPADVVGTSEYDLFPAELAEIALEDDRDVLESETHIDNKIEHVYGSVFDGTYVATSKAPWYDERGNVVGLVGVTRDVSEGKQSEHRLQRQNERLDRFAEVISHDLRNPIEVARGRLALARDAEDQTEHFDALERSLDRMDSLIEDVLELARRGETVDDPEAVHLGAIARDAWNGVDSGDATLVVESDRTVEADPGRLRQLLENLFRNAVDHAGRPDVTVTVRDNAGDTGFVVADDGVGIPESDRADVFEAGVSGTDDGTGLGLDIVQTIADAHGWHVTVTESPSGGAAFKFELHPPSAE